MLRLVLRRREADCEALVKVETHKEMPSHRTLRFDCWRDVSRDDSRRVHVYCYCLKCYSRTKIFSPQVEILVIRTATSCNGRVKQITNAPEYLYSSFVGMHLESIVSSREQCGYCVLHRLPTGHDKKSMHYGTHVKMGFRTRNREPIGYKL